jgi:hypothetical protein
MSAASSMVWHEVALTGSSAYQFEQQITDMVPFLNENWKAGVSAKTGNPCTSGRWCWWCTARTTSSCSTHHSEAGRHPRRLRSGDRVAAVPRPRLARFQSQARVAPLAARWAGRPADRDPFARQRSRPGDHPEGVAGDNPFIHDRHQIMKAVKHELGPAGRDLNFNAYADNRSLFRYDMHTLPSEISGASSIGTSTLFAAWNAAIYVAQVEDHRVAEAATTAAISRPPRTCCRGTAASGSTTNPT